MHGSVGSRAVTLVYPGTVGLAQGVGTLIGAATILRDQVSTGEPPTIRIVGDGADRAALIQQAQDHGLPNVIFSGPVRPPSSQPCWPHRMGSWSSFAKGPLRRLRCHEVSGGHGCGKADHRFRGRRGQSNRE